MSLSIVPFLRKINGAIINPLILLAFVVAFVYFIYGIVKFLSADMADKSRKEAQNAILWGIIGMVIMFSVYGIIGFVLSTFQVNPNDPSLQNAKPFIQPGQ